MTLAERIVEFLTQTPNQTSTQIANALQAEKPQVKVQLLKLHKAGKISRADGESTSLRGPKKVYLYAILG